jgi:hypothetical protein
VAIRERSLENFKLTTQVRGGEMVPARAWAFLDGMAMGYGSTRHDIVPSNQLPAE